MILEKKLIPTNKKPNAFHYLQVVQKNIPIDELKILVDLYFSIKIKNYLNDTN